VVGLLFSSPSTGAGREIMSPSRKKKRPNKKRKMPDGKIMIDRIIIILSGIFPLRE
jgi:hypothetical protein